MINQECEIDWTYTRVKLGREGLTSWNCFLSRMLLIILTFEQLDFVAVTDMPVIIFLF